jgi:regulator of protease activity HflC (stomatin/prohibitin superfamily)
MLEPGLHFKLPWPVDKVFKYPTKRIETLTIGVHEEHGKHEEHGARGDVILWTVEHGHGANNLIVASSETISGKREDLGAVPVNFLNTSVDIQYRINDLRTFLYKKEDPVKVLRSIASRELVRFMVSVDLFDIMGPGRLEASKYLARRIADACEHAELGLEIVYVGFENVHPPVEVAGAFEEVVGAIEEKHSSVLAAESYRNKILPLAEYQEKVLETRASAYKFRRETVAGARAEQFGNQHSADKSCSRVYRARKFLDTLEESLKNLRKYVVPEKAKAHQVTIVDMEEKLRPELLDIDLTGMEEE